MSLALPLGVQGTMDTDSKAWWRAAQPNILLLPDDVLAKILCQLPFRTKVRCHVVSRRFNTVLRRPEIDQVWGSVDQVY